MFTHCRVWHQIHGGIWHIMKSYIYNDDLEISIEHQHLQEDENIDLDQIKTNVVTTGLSCCYSVTVTVPTCKELHPVSWNTQIQSPSVIFLFLTDFLPTAKRWRMTCTTAWACFWLWCDVMLCVPGAFISLKHTILQSRALAGTYVTVW